MEAVKPKRKRRESDDDEWDEEQEQLTVAQVRSFSFINYYFIFNDISLLASRKM